jgi:hypothetical protein
MLLPDEMGKVWEKRFGCQGVWGPRVLTSSGMPGRTLAIVAGGRVDTILPACYRLRRCDDVDCSIYALSTAERSHQRTDE